MLWAASDQFNQSEFAQSITVCSGMLQTNAINQNLLWAASDQFPLMFNSNLIKINQYLLCDASDQFRKTINGHLMSPRKRLLGI